ncbi:MAG: hypothetical protein GEV12_14335 [Micromonosporaceae bacterium]|nr:hypothetical protein [Micromonosporaceae bacterium]
MTFSLRTVIDDADLPPFAFEDSNGKQRELPHVQTLTTRQALAAMDGDVETVFKEIAPDVSDLLLDLPAFAVEALIKEWLAHSNIDLEDSKGKSPAASRSSGATATQSKRTSRSGGSRSRR